MEPIKFKDLLINFTTAFDLLWSVKKSGVVDAACFWRPNTSSDALHGFSLLGDVIVADYRNINNRKIVAVVSEVDKINGTALRVPLDFVPVWKNSGKKVITEISIWRPIAPEGYVAMGTLCCIGYDKPLLNTVRCVRADLVANAYIGNAIWNDKGSGSKMDFSAWETETAEVEPGEAYISTGVFYGHHSFARPSFGARPYSLRMELPVMERPLPAPPAPGGVSGEDRSPEVCKLPWFIVKDSNLTPLEQYQHSPTYRLERSDSYITIGIGKNTTRETKTFKWSAIKGETRDNSIDLKTLTGIDFISEWSSTSQPVGFSASLNKNFTHTSQSAKDWATTSTLEVAAYVPANQTIAAHLLYSQYRLLRKDGTQLGATVRYINGDHVYYSESSTAIAQGSEETPLPSTNEDPINETPAPTPSTETNLEVTPHDVRDDTLVP